MWCLVWFGQSPTDCGGLGARIGFEGGLGAGIGFKGILEQVLV